MDFTGAKERDIKMISESTSIITDNTFSHCVKKLMGRCPELDEETVNKYFQIFGTSWNRVGVQLVKETAFDPLIVHFLSN